MAKGIDLLEDNQVPYVFDLQTAFDNLTGQQKIAIYNWYVEDTRAKYCADELGHPIALVRGMFVRFEFIENLMQILMKGEYVVTPAIPAEYDEQGNVITPEVPAVYAPVPSTEAQLKSFVNTAYTAYATENNITPVFSTAEVNAVVGFILTNSRKDVNGIYNGDFAFYKNYFA